MQIPLNANQPLNKMTKIIITTIEAEAPIIVMEWRTKRSELTLSANS